jgi:hypothetical protein
MNNFISGYQAGQQVKERRNELAKQEKFNSLAGGLYTTKDRAPVLAQMAGIDPQATAPLANYFGQQDKQAAAEAKAAEQEKARLSLNKVNLVRYAPKGRKIGLIQQIAPDFYQQNMADGTPPTDEEIDMFIDQQLPELHSRAGVEFKPEVPYTINQQEGPNGSTILSDGKRFDVVHGGGSGSPVNRQLTTRPVGNGKVQDFGYNPRTNQLEPVGQPYDSDPGGVNSKKGAMPLRKEFRNLDSVKNYETILPLIKSAEKAPDTGYGDLQLIYTVGKTLDPGSVVREGELALTIAAGSPLQRVLGATRFNFEKGGRLTPQQRGQIIDMLNQRVAAAKTAYDRDYGQYSQYAKESGVDPSMVVGGSFNEAFEQKPQGGVKFLGFE